MIRPAIDTHALQAHEAEIREKYQTLLSENLTLDVTRGKPSDEQLDLSEELLSLPGKKYRTPSGVDTRNYGGLTGITELRQLWADLLGIPVNNVFAGNSSSLNMSFDIISWAFSLGTQDSQQPWSAEETVKWICPVPGYDRHHSITEHFGFEMVTVDLDQNGPNMDQVHKLVKDPHVKGMWTVPIFSNPTGIIYSDDVVKQLAEMETAASDFRIMWDNAYLVHTLTDEFPSIPDVIAISEAAGNPNRFFQMNSTSKITLAGAGVSFLSSSESNLEWYAQNAGIRGIGPNKVNQLAHLEFLRSADGVKDLMRKHAHILAPKFDKVLEILDQRLSQFGVAQWSHPTGGYFIDLNVIPGTARRVVELAKNAGISLTAAGSTYPYGKDPQDQNIRLAPSMPTPEQLAVAMDGVATCVLLAALEHLGQHQKVLHA